MRKAGTAFLTGLFLASCQPAAPPRVTPDQRHTVPVVPNPYASKPGDEKWTRGGLDIQHATLDISTLTITGNLPTPCHELRLRIPGSLDSKGFLRIEAWSVFDPALMCAQMIQPFAVDLKVPVYPESAIAVNGKIVGY